MNDLYETVTDQDDPERYLIEIQEPIQIPAVVIESKKRAQETGTPQEYILDHQEEPNAIRGYSQPLDGGIRRPDGGLTWYHNMTGCLNRAYPMDDTDRRGHQQQAWGETVKTLMASVEGTSSDAYTWHNADIYTEEGQITGTSARNRDGIRIERACWYEDDPASEVFDSLLQEDGIKPERFYDQVVIPSNSVIDHLGTEHHYRVIDEDELDQFISDESMEEAKHLQEIETGTRRGSCLLGPRKEDS